MSVTQLGVIGTGWFASTLTAAAATTGRGRVASCFARSPKRRDDFAQRHGCAAADSVDALLGDPEITGVLIATPHSTHEELVVAAAQAGKHVFVEKPLTLTRAAAERAIAATEDAGVTLQVGHNRRRQAANRHIAAMIEHDELGRVLQVDAVHTSPIGHDPSLPGWRADPDECPAGGMSALGVHMVDTFHYFLGPATRVMAMSTRRGEASGLDRATTVLIEYAAGPLATLSTSCYATVVTSLSVHGEDAAVWNEADGARLLLQARGEKARRDLGVEVVDTIADEIDEFISCIRGEARPETGAAEGREVAAVLDAIVASIDGRCAVDVARSDAQA